MSNTKFLEDTKKFLSVVYIEKYYPVPLFLLEKKVKEDCYTLKLSRYGVEGVKGITNRFVLILNLNIESTRPTYEEMVL